VRDLFLEREYAVEVTDITGAPWIEIDYPDDVVRALRDVLPLLRALPVRAVRPAQNTGL
jgi:choline kinase